MSTFWQVAKSIEAEGNKMYLEFERNAPNREIAGVFSALAGEERRHYELFEKLEKHRVIELEPPGPVSVDIPKLFDAIRTELLIDDRAMDAMKDAETIYQQALVLEKSSINFFNKILAGLTDEYQKGVVNVIIGEEMRHIAVINGLMDFVHRPKEWLENAEVYHSDKY